MTTLSNARTIVTATIDPAAPACVSCDMGAEHAEYAAWHMLDMCFVLPAGEVPNDGTVGGPALLAEYAAMVNGADA